MEMVKIDKKVMMNLVFVFKIMIDKMISEA